MRVDMAFTNAQYPYPCQVSNGDEARYPSTLLNTFTKALVHNDSLIVDQASYNSLLRALNSGLQSDFAAIIMGGERHLTSPQAGLAFELIGKDPQQYFVPPAPMFSSAWFAGELVEQYWEALLRDIPFDQYGVDPLSIAASVDLKKLSDFRGPTDASQLFRGTLPGCSTGIYLSQFLYQRTFFGASEINMKVPSTTVGDDFMTTWSDLLSITRGHFPTRNQTLGAVRYMINGRDLAQWVHIDVVFQAYFQALLHLMKAGAPLKPSVPYVLDPTQDGFATYGAAAFPQIVAQVSSNALHAAWFQKWYVHRRARPEVSAGRVDRTLYGGANYPLHKDVLNADVIARLFAKFGNALLPMAFPEGSPIHPAYPAGHATVAGACTTILKALFQEDWVFPSPVKPSADGSTLLPYVGTLTLGGELNKLAANIAIGRNIAGVHWRSDADESFRLGEQVAISFLRDVKYSLHETNPTFTFTNFDGNVVQIN